MTYGEFGCQRSLECEGHWGIIIKDRHLLKLVCFLLTGGRRLTVLGIMKVRSLYCENSIEV